MILLAITAATPLLLAVLGETIVQRGGIINLGIEGMMLTAAMTAVLAAQGMHSAAIGFLGGVAGAAVVGAIFGVFAIELRADQIVTGVAVNLLALGVTGFVYRELEQSALFVHAVPRVGRDGVVPLAWIVAPIALSLLLWNTTFGLRLRACGENPDAVASVRMHRWSALMIESALTGVAGAHLALALSIVIFGRWKLKGAILGTALFGIAAAAQYALQAMNRGIEFHLLLALPYVVTLLILCGIAGRVRAPEALGKAA